MGTRCADHVTPLYPRKLALNSPTGGGRSVGIVRVQTTATEFRDYVGIVTLITLHVFSNLLAQKWPPMVSDSTLYAELNL